MKLLRYELKKFFGVRYLWVTLLLTLAASAGFYYFLWIGPDGYGVKHPPREKTEAIADFLRRCEEEPEEIAPLREEYEEYVREAERVSAEIKAGMTDEELVGFRVTEEMLAEHGVTYENKLGYTIGDGTPIPDSELFDYYDLLIMMWDSMLSHLDNVIDLTNGAMIRYESAGATALPVYSYERHFHDVYSALRERLGGTDVGLGYEHGWAMMFYFLELPVFMFAYLLLASLCASLSFAVKKVPPTLFAVAAVTLLPYVFVYMGQQVFRFVDVTPMLAGGGLLLRSAELGIFGGTYAFALIFAAGYAALALAASLLVRHRTGE